MTFSFRESIMRMRSFARKRPLDSEIEQELASHLQFAIDENIAKGMPPQEAERRARISFGGPQQSKESHRESRGLPFLESLLRDIRYAARALSKTPAFTLAAILTLALGIGANTAIFSAVYAVLLKPLPFLDVSRLTFVMKKNPPRGWDRNQVSPAEILAWRREGGVFEDVATFRQTTCVLTGMGEAKEAPCEITTANLFPLLGAAPLRGRTFSPSEDFAGSAHTVVLSHGLWQQQFGGDESAIGRTIRVNGVLHEIVGVMPANFSHLYGSPFGAVPLLWVSGIALSQNEESNDSLAIARLNPGIALAQASSQLDAVSARLEQTHPGLKGWRPQLFTLRENSSGNTRLALLTLMGAVMFVLLIACANLANLLLARGAGRTGEFAVRNALGAGGSRLLRQLLTESLVLSLSGGTLGVLLAFWGCKGLVALAPSFLLNSATGLVSGAVNLGVLGFTLVVVLLTGVLFGLAPALQAIRVQITDNLREIGRSALQSPRSRRLRNTLVVVEISLATVLLTGAGLMVRTLAQLNRQPLGFDPSNVLTLRVNLTGDRYQTPQAQAQFWDRLLLRVKTLSGVEFATISREVVIDSWVGQFFTTSEQPNPPAGEVPDANYLVAAPDYFRTLRIPIRRGRAFADDDSQAGERVAIVNEELARKYWPNQDPLGKKLRLGMPADENPWLTVIGVAGNVLSRGADAGFSPEIYVPYQQYPWIVQPRHLIVRTTTGADSAALVRSLLHEVHAIDQGQPVSKIATMNQLAAEQIVQQRMVMALLLAFAALALALSAVGIYSVISYSVSQLTPELGLRMALGAQADQILRRVLGGGLRLLLPGLALGALAAVVLTRLMTDLLFGVGPTDPFTFGIVLLTLAAISLFACYLPARRAARVEPVVALRYE